MLTQNPSRVLPRQHLPAPWPTQSAGYMLACQITFRTIFLRLESTASMLFKMSSHPPCSILNSLHHYDELHGRCLCADPSTITMTTWQQSWHAHGPTTHNPTNTYCTSPKFNIALKKWWFSKRSFPIGFRQLFRGKYAVKLWEGIRFKTSRCHLVQLGAAESSIFAQSTGHSQQKQFFTRCELSHKIARNYKWRVNRGPRRPYDQGLLIIGFPLVSLNKAENYIHISGRGYVNGGLGWPAMIFTWSGSSNPSQRYPTSVSWSCNQFPATMSIAAEKAWRLLKFHHLQALWKQDVNEKFRRSWHSDVSLISDPGTKEARCCVFL